MSLKGKATGDTTPNSPATTPSSPATPPRTDPLSGEQFTGWDGGPYAITAFREYDAAASPEWEIPRNVKRATLGGSRSCDIAIPGRGLSATHCLLERRANKLRIYDQHTMNGTYVRNYAIESADLDPGDVFTPRPITLVAMNDEMRRHRQTLVEIVGTGFTRSPDWVMVQAAGQSGPLLITGEAGCDQSRLAQAIHAMSIRRTKPLVEVTSMPEGRAAQVALVKQAQKTTLALTIHPGQDSLDAAFASILFSTSYAVRPIILAATEQDARNALGDQLISLTQHIPLLPLAYRAVEISQLLDHMLEERNVGQLRTADMSRHNQDALCSYHWPGNFDTLRLLADAIVAHESAGGVRGAARSMGVSRGKIERLFEKVGLQLPLFV